MAARISFFGVGLSLLGALSCTEGYWLNTDQERSCQRRLAWSEEHQRECAICQSASVEPRCDCTDVAEKYKSQCRVLAAQVQAAGACTDAQRVSHSGCLSRCHDNCACEDACLNALPYGCARAQQDLDSCVTTTCDEVCK